MSLRSITQSPPQGLLRLALRLPVLLYRCGLGWLLGNRFLMIMHKGRKSGKVHRTVLEVVDFDAKTGAYKVASGWGEKANWYRNVVVTPEVQVQVGKRVFLAIAERLSEATAKMVLKQYAHVHPVAFKELAWIMIGERLSDPEEVIERMGNTIPILDLHPKVES